MVSDRSYEFPIDSTAAAYVIPLTPGRGGGRKNSTVGCMVSHSSYFRCAHAYTAAMRPSIKMASYCLFLISKTASTNTYFRAWKKFKLLFTP